MNENLVMKSRMASGFPVGNFRKVHYRGLGQLHML